MPPETRPAAPVQVPIPAEVIARTRESPSMFTLRLRPRSQRHHGMYTCTPGQFNMLYLFGIGEVPISIVSVNAQQDWLAHTIRAVGRVTRGLAKLQVGDTVGLRGPFGRGWPLETTRGRDVVVITGGLGCAPVVAVIHHVLAHRGNFGRLTVLQGVKHSDDLIWRAQYEEWRRQPDTEVWLAADVSGGAWPWYVGRITELLDKVSTDLSNSVCMLCGPEIMMRNAIARLVARQVSEDDIWLSTERNMQCGIGHCGHCQIGGKFVCRDGPVFNYPEIRKIFGTPGF